MIREIFYGFLILLWYGQVVKSPGGAVSYRLCGGRDSAGELLS